MGELARMVVATEPDAAAHDAIGPARLVPPRVRAGGPAMVPGVVMAGHGPTSVSLDAAAAARPGMNVGVLARVIARPLVAGDGTYRVEVALHPADLGALRAVVTLRGGDLQVLLTPQTRQGHDVLARDLGALKAALSGDGLRVGVTVRDPSQRGAGERHGVGDRAPRPRSSETREIVVTVHDQGVAGGQIHLLL